MKIIGITGEAGAGKTTFAGYLIEALSVLEGSWVSCRKLSFATPIKDALGAMLDLDRYYFEDRDKKERSLDVYPGLGTPRSLMQSLGTEWGRELIGPDLWVDIAKAKAKKFGDAGINYLLIDDVRFDNVARWVDEQGGVIIEVERDDIAIAGAHVSENGLTSLPSYTVDNIGDEKALRFTAYSLALEITGHKGYRTPSDPMRVPDPKRRLNDATPEEWDRASHEAVPALG